MNAFKKGVSLNTLPPSFSFLLLPPSSPFSAEPPSVEAESRGVEMVVLGVGVWGPLLSLLLYPLPAQFLHQFYALLNDFLPLLPHDAIRFVLEEVI